MVFIVYTFIEIILRIPYLSENTFLAKKYKYVYTVSCAQRKFITKYYLLSYFNYY